MWPWLKSVTTLEPTWNRVTFGPTATTSPAPSLPGITPDLFANGYIPGRVSYCLVLVAWDRSPRRKFVLEIGGDGIFLPMNLVSHCHSFEVYIVMRHTFWND